MERIGQLLDLNIIKDFFKRPNKTQFEYTGLERTDGLANHGYRGLGDELAAKESYNFSRRYGFNPFSDDIFDSLDDIVREYIDVEFDAILRISHYPKIKIDISGNKSEGDGDSIYRLAPHKDYGILTLYYEYTPNTGFQIFRNNEWIDIGSCVIWNEPHRVIYTDPIKEKWSITYHVDHKNCKIPMKTRLGIKN